MRFAAIALSAAIATMVFGARVSAQEKVLLKDVTAAGDVYDTNDQMTTTFEVHVTVAGQPEQIVKMANGEQELYRTRVLAAAGGEPTAIRRTYTVATSSETGPAGTKQRRSSLHGRTVTAKRAGGKVLVTVDKGKLDPSDEAKVRKVVTSGRMHFLPGREVSVGEEWVIDPEQAKKDLQGADSAVAKGKLTEIVDHLGHRCARIAVTFDVSGKMGTATFPMHIQLAGDGYFALDLHRTVELKLSGPISGKGETDQGGSKTAFTIDGTMEMHSTEKPAALAK